MDVLRRIFVSVPPSWTSDPLSGYHSIKHHSV